MTCFIDSFNLRFELPKEKCLSCWTNLLVKFVNGGALLVTNHVIACISSDYYRGSTELHIYIREQTCMQVSHIFATLGHWLLAACTLASLHHVSFLHEILDVRCYQSRRKMRISSTFIKVHSIFSWYDYVAFASFMVSFRFMVYHTLSFIRFMLRSFSKFLFDVPRRELEVLDIL